MCVNISIIFTHSQTLNVSLVRLLFTFFSTAGGRLIDSYAAHIAAHLSCGRMAAALFRLIVLLVKVVLIGHEAGACVAAGTHEVGQIVFGIGRTAHGFPMHLTVVPEPVEEVAAQGGILVHGEIGHVFETGHVVLVVIE